MDVLKSERRQQRLLLGYSLLHNQCQLLLRRSLRALSPGGRADGDTNDHMGNNNGTLEDGAGYAPGER